MKKRLYLQLFADPAPADPSPQDPNPNEPEEPDSPKAGASKPVDSKSQPKYTDEDVNRLIDQKFAEWQKKKEKELNEAKKLAEMSEAEKQKFSNEKLQKQLDALMQEKALSDMSKQARSILAEKDIRISDELLSVMVTTDAEQTKKAVDSFSELFQDAVKKAVGEALKGGTPKGSAGSKTTMKKEDILKIKDPELRQQKMLENRELFNI